jgi:hypothetical protein
MTSAALISRGFSRDTVPSSPWQAIKLRLHKQNNHNLCPVLSLLRILKRVLQSKDYPRKKVVYLHKHSKCQSWYFYKMCSTLAVLNYCWWHLDFSTSWVFYYSHQWVLQCWSLGAFRQRPLMDTNAVQQAKVRPERNSHPGGSSSRVWNPHAMYSLYDARHLNTSKKRSKARLSTRTNQIYWYERASSTSSSMQPFCQ